MTRHTASVLILLGLLLALFWLAPDVPLLGFAAVLVAVALRAGADPLAARTRLPEPVAVGLVMVGVLLALGLAAWAAHGPLAEEATQLAQELPRSVQALREQLVEYRWAKWLLENADAGRMLGGSGGTHAGVVAVAAAGRTLGVLSDVALVLITAAYLAVFPQPYLTGLRRLFEPRVDAPVRVAMVETGAALRGFLLGQAFAMVVSGVLTWVGLLILGVPLAGVLAVITAVLGFIPVLGPVIAAVPAVLLALLDSPSTALWVAGLFVLIQTIEGNILTPLVQSRVADVPPALLLPAQLLLGSLYGLLGVALSAPMVAVAIVLVRRGYVEAWLGRAEGD